MKVFRLFVFLFFISTGYHAQITVKTDAFAIDSNRKLILINHGIAEFNTIFPRTKKDISINGSYVFSFVSSVDELKNGVRYEVKYEGENYHLYFSELPLIKMNIADEIKDFLKVIGTFELYAPLFTPVKSVVGVEYRGAFSQSYPKKSMEIEFNTDKSGEEEQDFSLLGLIENSGWNLQAMYKESSESKYLRYKWSFGTDKI